MPVNMKLVIAEAFFNLSKEKSIDKITVKDLVETCNISRQSFYYHFQDILEVIEWSAQQAFQKLLDESLKADNPEQVLYDFLTASEEAGTLLQKLLHSQRREQVEHLMVQSVCKYLQELIIRKGPRPNLPYEDLQTALRFCSYGIVGLMQESCEKKEADRKKLAQQICRLLMGRQEEACSK